jgi:hypothetical protein
MLQGMLPISHLKWLIVAENQSLSEPVTCITAEGLIAQTFVVLPGAPAGPDQCTSQPGALLST